MEALIKEHRTVVQRLMMAIDNLSQLFSIFHQNNANSIEDWVLYSLLGYSKYIVNLPAQKGNLAVLYCRDILVSASLHCTHKSQQNHTV